jgi:hypothetical protein
MPLPDERPRQSVANLIGRFEQQTKRNPPITTPGSPGVTSNITGDAVKEEIKEKREWPPKPLLSNVTPSPIIPSSSWSRAAKLQPTPLQTSPPAVADEVAQIAVKVELPTPSSASAPGPPSPKSPIVPQRQLSSGSTQSVKSSSAPRPPSSPVKVPAARASIAGNSKILHKEATAKSPPKTSLPSSFSQPSLKPQHTGQSTTSTSTARSPKSGVRAMPSTPSRSKTPSSLSPRSKTPSSMSPRPKTPSSGLFAPTAASLARARSTVPQLPTPVKKTTLSTSVSERLSKPTAASLSKARSPVPTAVASTNRTPSRVTSASRGGAPVKGVLKTRSTSTKGKQDVAPAGPPPPGSEVDEVDSHDEVEHSDFGHDLEASVLSESVGSLAPLREISHVEETAEHSPKALFETNGDLTATPEAGLTPNVRSMNPSPEPTLPAHHSRESTLDVEQEPLPTKEDRLDEVKSRVEDNIEDMVNFLESAPLSKARPLSIASIPDEEVQEIPDEE